MRSVRSLLIGVAGVLLLQVSGAAASASVARDHVAGVGEESEFPPGTGPAPSPSPSKRRRRRKLSLVSNLMHDLELTDRQKMYLGLALMALLHLAKKLGFGKKGQSKYGDVVERQRRKGKEREEREERGGGDGKGGRKKKEA